MTLWTRPQHWMAVAYAVGRLNKRTCLDRGQLGGTSLHISEWDLSLESRDTDSQLCRTSKTMGLQTLSEQYPSRMGWGEDGKDELACHSSHLPYPQQRGWGRGHGAHPQFQGKRGCWTEFRPAVLPVPQSPCDDSLLQPPCLPGSMH